MALVEVIDQIQIKNNPSQGVVLQSRVIGGTGWIRDDNTARDAIPSASREIGMEVKVLSPEKYFKLEADLTTWTERVQTGYVLTSEKGVANGVAPLDANGFIPSIHIKNLFLNDSFIYASEALMLADTTLTGNFAIRTDSGDVYVKLNNNGPPSVIGDWSVLSSPGVATVNGLTGGVSIDFTTLLTWGSSEAQFQAKVVNSDYAVTTNSSISALQTRTTNLETDQHTHTNKALLDTLISSGDGLAYLGNNGSYVTLHTHTNKAAIDKVDDSGGGTLFLADDGTYKATPGGLGDAPIDGSTYARKDAAWISIGGTIGGSITNDQIAIGASTANNIEGSSDFLWTGTIFTAKNGTSSFIANMAATPTVVLAGTGTNNNTSMTVSALGTGTAQAYFDAIVGATGGDPFIRFRDTAGWSYALGVDNSDSNNFKLRYIASAAASPSNGTALLTVTTAGLFTFHSNVGGGGTTKYLRADGTWAVPPVGGDVTKVGTSANNQIGVWTGDGTIEGDTNFTWDGSGSFTLKKTTAGYAGISLLNSDATSTSNSFYYASVLSTGGDPYMLWTIAANTRSYALGIDNSDSDIFKLTTDTVLSSPSSGTLLLSVTTAGLFTFHSNVGGGGITNFLRADGTWAAPPVGGDVTAGVQSANQVAYWNATSKQIEGNSGLSYNTTGFYISKNIGLGVTSLHSWPGSFRVIETGQSALLFNHTSSGPGVNLVSNAYFDGVWKRLSGTGICQAFNQNPGGLELRIAAGGLIDSAITWVKGLTMNVSGRLTFGVQPLLDTGFSTSVLLTRDIAGNIDSLPSSGGGTTKYLRADGTWAAPPVSINVTALTDGAAIAYNLESKILGLKTLTTTQTTITLTLSNIIAGANQVLSVTKTNAADTTITLAGTGLTFYGYNSADLNTTPNIVLSGTAGDVFDLSFLARSATEIGVAVGAKGN